MRKLLIGLLLGLVVIVVSFGVFTLYKEYSLSQYTSKREKVVSMIDKEGRKILKTNDLIFFCELVNELEYDESTSKIQLVSETHSAKYKEFSNLIRAKIKSNPKFNEFNADTDKFMQEALCNYTLAGRYNFSVYATLLSKKYDQKENHGSIGDLENVTLSEADAMEFFQAKSAASKIRETY